MLKAVGDLKRVVRAEIEPCSQCWQLLCTAGPCDAAAGTVLSLVPGNPVLLLSAGRAVFCTFLINVCLQPELLS